MPLNPPTQRQQKCNKKATAKPRARANRSRGHKGQLQGQHPSTQRGRSPQCRVTKRRKVEPSDSEREPEDEESEEEHKEETDEDQYEEEEEEEEEQHEGEEDKEEGGSQVVLCCLICSRSRDQKDCKTKFKHIILTHSKFLQIFGFVY